jgi:hypothetical protein
MSDIYRPLLFPRLPCSAFRPPCFPCSRPSSVFRVPFRPPPCSVLRVPSSVFRVPSSVFRPPCSVLRVPCSVLRIPCSVLRVPSSVFRVPSSVFRGPSSVFRPYSVLRVPYSVLRGPSSLCVQSTADTQYLSCNILRHIGAQENTGIGYFKGIAQPF